MIKYLNPILFAPKSQHTTVEKKVIFWYGQSNCSRQAPRATLDPQYQTSFPLIHEWVGDTETLIDLDWMTYNNSGAEFSLMTRIQSFYNSDVYFCRGAWGDCGLAQGAGGSGDLTPTLSTSHYHEATEYWNGMISKFSMTQSSIKCMVLIMGESDAHASYASSYATNMTALIANIRSVMNLPALPVIITKLSTSINATTCPTFATINTAIDTVTGSVSGVYSVNTNTCTFQAGDIHYDADGLDTLGELIYNCMISNNILT